jgi:hypothetical protein
MTAPPRAPTPRNRPGLAATCSKKGVRLAQKMQAGPCIPAIKGWSWPNFWTNSAYVFLTYLRPEHGFDGVTEEQVGGGDDAGAEPGRAEGAYPWPIESHTPIPLFTYHLPFFLMDNHALME